MLERRQMIRCGAGFLPSPLLYGGSGNGKIVHQEQPGEPTRMKTESSAAALCDVIREPASFHHRDPLECAGAGADAMSEPALWSKRFASLASTSRWSRRAIHDARLHGHARTVQ